MNYRHAYHAGNFCDVLKHTVLALCLRHLAIKQTPFFVLDTHGGTGIYDIAGAQAGKTGEAAAGIGKLWSASLSSPAAALMAPYLDIVRDMNPGPLSIYPGSPEIARQLSRPQDRLVFCELHPQDAAALAHNCRRDRRIRVEAMDGWQALKAFLPPKERRGLILIDPAFEERNELDRLTQGFRQAMRRFATGIYILWYPIKDDAATQRFCETLKAESPSELLQISLRIGRPTDSDRLDATGLVVANPPYTLEDDLRNIVPELARVLRQGDGAGWSMDWLKREWTA